MKKILYSIILTLVFLTFAVKEVRADNPNERTVIVIGSPNKNHKISNPNRKIITCNQWDKSVMVMINPPEVYLNNGASYDDYLEDFNWLYWNYNLCKNASIKPLPRPE